MAMHRSSSEWAALLRSYHRSDLTQAEFCRRKGITVASLGYHLRRDRPVGPVSDAPELIELAPFPPASLASVRAGEARIELGTALGPVTVHGPACEVARILAAITPAPAVP